jgi:hypothetical protein
MIDKELSDLEKCYTVEGLMGMKLHDSYSIPGITITKVPGGWVYTFGAENQLTKSLELISSVFVPEPPGEVTHEKENQK